MASGYMRKDKDKDKKKKKGPSKATAEYWEGVDDEKDKMEGKKNKAARSLAC